MHKHKCVSGDLILLPDYIFTSKLKANQPAPLATAKRW